MGEVVAITGGVPEKPNATPGQTLFGAIVDYFTEGPAPTVLPRSVIAVAVRHGCQALEDGCDPDVVLAGCLQALREGKGRFALDYIAEMAVVKTGNHDTPKDRAHRIAQFKDDPHAARERAMITKALGKETG